MKAYGYDLKSKFVELKEVSLECSLEELKKIADFLNYADKLHSSDLCKNDYCHSHYRDWDKSFKIGSSDLIIITNIDKGLKK